MEPEGHSLAEATGPSADIFQAIERAAASHAAALGALRREVAALARADGDDGPGPAVMDVPVFLEPAAMPSPPHPEPEAVMATDALSPQIPAAAPARTDAGPGLAEGDPAADLLPTIVPRGASPMPETGLSIASVRVLDWWDDQQPVLRAFAAVVLVALVAWLAGLAGLAGLSLVLAR